MPSDCASGICIGMMCAPSSCSDGVVNGAETDIDCGGAVCKSRCPNFAKCKNSTDCDTVCFNPLVR